MRRTPLRSNKKKTAEWRRRSKPLARGRVDGKPRGAGPKRSAIRKISTRRRSEIAERRATEIPIGPREPVLDGPDHALRKWVGLLACAVRLDRQRPVEAAHHKAKRRNGDWLRCPDTGAVRGNLMPLSTDEHGEQHLLGIATYAASRGINLDDLCAAVGRAYMDGWTAYALSHAARLAGGYERVDLDNPPIDPLLEAP